MEARRFIRRAEGRRTGIELVGPGRHCSPRHELPCNARTSDQNACRTADDEAGSICQALSTERRRRRCTPSPLNKVTRKERFASARAI
jgi:hypothetical protein